MLKKEEAKKFGSHPGKKIQSARKAENLSLEELSNQTELSVRRIERWETSGGARLPAVELAMPAKALHTDLDDILDDC